MPQKHSQKRDAIIDALKRTTSHPTAEELYQSLKETHPELSLATVYRNLNLLLENGEIQVVDVGDGQKHFDGTVCTHYHFYCETCKRVYDIPLPLITGLEASIKQSYGHRPYRHTMEFYGLCADCASKADKKI